MILKNRKEIIIEKKISILRYKMIFFSFFVTACLIILLKRYQGNLHGFKLN